MGLLPECGRLHQSGSIDCVLKENKMSPLQPHWAQPSYPDVKEVVFNVDFMSKSMSKVGLSPFAKMVFPPSEGC